MEILKQVQDDKVGVQNDNWWAQDDNYASNFLSISFTIFGLADPLVSFMVASIHSEKSVNNPMRITNAIPMGILRIKVKVLRILVHNFMVLPLYCIGSL